MFKYRAEGNVLEFELWRPVDVDAVEARARETQAEVSRAGDTVKVVYRARDKVATYEFTPDGVRGRVEYSEPVSDPERAAESQRRLIEEYWLGRAGVAQGETKEMAVQPGGGIRALIVETARRLWEDRGVAPSAREIARALGYKSPRILYGPGRFSSLREIYAEAGIPVEEARTFPGAEARAEEVQIAAPGPAPAPGSELEPIEGYELEARIVDGTLEKEVEIRILGAVTRSRMRLPLEEPLVVGGSGVKVRIIPGRPVVVEIWKRKRTRPKREAKKAKGEK